MVLRDFKAPARQKQKAKGGAVSEEDSLSVTTLSVTPRTNTVQEEDKKGRWFQKLNWEEEERMQKFGLHKNLQQMITKKPTAPSRSRNMIPASVLTKLAETSNKTFEDGFD